MSLSNISLDLAGFAVVKNPPANEGNVRNTGLILGSERSPGEENGNPLSCSSWEIPWTQALGGLQSMGSQKSQTGLSD